VIKPTSKQPEMEPLTRTQVLVAMGLTAVLWLITAKIWLQTPFSAGLLPIHWQPLHILMGLGVGLIIILASAVVYRVWPGYQQAADFYLEMVLRPLSWPDLIWLGLLPGLSEELLFRGVMLPAAGLDWIGVMLSSVCFGVLHLSGLQQWPYVVWATLVGLLLGYSALATGNLLVPILAHVCTNLVASILWKLRNPSYDSSRKA
jgi:hypothetical protein